MQRKVGGKSGSDGGITDAGQDTIRTHNFKRSGWKIFISKAKNSGWVGLGWVEQRRLAKGGTISGQNRGWRRRNKQTSSGRPVREWNKMS